MTAGLGFCSPPAETGFARTANIGFLHSLFRTCKALYYSRSQLKDIEKLIEEHKDEIISAWGKYFKN